MIKQHLGGRQRERPKEKLKLRWNDTMKQDLGHRLEKTSSRERLKTTWKIQKIDGERSRGRTNLGDDPSQHRTHFAEKLYRTSLLGIVLKKDR